MPFKRDAHVGYLLFLLIGEGDKYSELTVLHPVHFAVFVRPYYDGICAGNHRNDNIHSKHDKQHQCGISRKTRFKLAQEPFPKYLVHYRSSSSAAGMRVSLR